MILLLVLLFFGDWKWLNAWEILIPRSGCSLQKKCPQIIGSSDKSRHYCLLNILWTVLQMFTVLRMLEYTFLLMQRSESKSVVLVNVRLLHWDDLAVLIDLTEPRWLNRVDNRVLHKLDHCQWIQCLEPFFLGLHFVVIFLIVEIRQKVTVLQVLMLIVVHS